MLPKNNHFVLGCAFLLLLLGSCSKPKDHLDIVNPYANQVRQLSFEEFRSNEYNQNIYPFKAIGIQLIDPDSLGPDELCILDGTDTLTYQEFETEGYHQFMVVNESGDTIRNEFLYLNNQVTSVFFYLSVIPIGQANPLTEVWKPIRFKVPGIPPFYSEYYEIRDYKLNTIFSSNSFDSAWTATGSHGPYYYYARYVDWFGKIHERKGEIVVLK